ncbi:MAG TPA: CPBP family intramembrane glutamic endopeptidase [Pseudonocardiaceae bacterium]|nr:CPBP family intramembrane glutamic endopeptidase [Pseudonocardiaceae bacterium]
MRDTGARLLVAIASVAGGTQLGLSLASRPDSPRFYGLTAGVATTWLVAGTAARPAHDTPDGRSVAGPIALGVAAFAAFYTAAPVARRIPVLGRAVAGALGYAHHGRTPLVLATTLLNGVAEEVFFRGAVYDLAGDHAVATSTAVYVSVTAATRNPALVLASLVMGTLFAWQRRTSGDVWAPILTHLTWSILMLTVLPGRFAGTARDGSMVPRP